MEGAIIVSASKGIEQKTHLTPSGILGSVLPKGFNERIAIISGPTFAKEVSMGLPSASAPRPPPLSSPKRFKRFFQRRRSGYIPIPIQSGLS